MTNHQENNTHSLTVPEAGGESRTKEPLGKEIDRRGSTMSFALVTTMLYILGALVFVLLLLPLIGGGSDKQMEYYKWALTTLAGTFGAWIGAGAAYFFGKENLVESSTSTEKALSLQQKLFQRGPQFERIQDMVLTPINPNFMFTPGQSKSDVLKKLKTFRGYWFVPVVDELTRKLHDIIHGQIFWDPSIAETLTLEAVTTEIDKKDETKKLHGEGLYIEISSNDKVSDVYKSLTRRGAELAIVVDDQGKPLQCVTKNDLRIYLRLAD